MTAMAKGTGRGGRREGAGRPRGAKNKRSTKLIERAKTKGLELPLPRLLRRMNDLELPEKYRDHLAALAAPYCHARLSAVAEMKRPSQMTDEHDVKHRFGRVILTINTAHPFFIHLYDPVSKMGLTQSGDDGAEEIVSASASEQQGCRIFGNTKTRQGPCTRRRRT